MKLPHTEAASRTHSQVASAGTLEGAAAAAAGEEEEEGEEGGNEGVERIHGEGGGEGVGGIHGEEERERAARETTGGMATLVEEEEGRIRSGATCAGVDCMHCDCSLRVFLSS